MPISACLIDSNILLRIARHSDPLNQVIDTALSGLARQKTALYYTHQNIAEIWNAMTRPLSRNGFGLTTHEAQREVRAIESGMTLLPDNEEIYHEWRRLIVQHRISGVQVHDARLAAAMYVHGVTHILTLNGTDFSRFSDLSAVHPSTVSNLGL